MTNWQYLIVWFLFFFDLAELKVILQQPLEISDWIVELDRFTTIYGKGTLTDSGSISHDKALEKAEIEYRKFQLKTLSPVEEAYLDSIKKISKDDLLKSKNKK